MAHHVHKSTRQCVDFIIGRHIRIVKNVFLNAELIHQLWITATLRKKNRNKSKSLVWVASLPGPGLTWITDGSASTGLLWRPPYEFRFFYELRRADFKIRRQIHSLHLLCFYVNYRRPVWKDLITLYVVSMHIFETRTVLLRPLACGRPLVVFNVMGIAPTNIVVHVFRFFPCRMFFGAHEVMSGHVSRQRVSRNASLRCLLVC